METCWFSGKISHSTYLTPLSQTMNRTQLRSEALEDMRQQLLECVQRFAAFEEEEIRRDKEVEAAEKRNEALHLEIMELKDLVQIQSSQLRQREEDIARLTADLGEALSQIASLEGEPSSERFPS